MALSAAAQSVLEAIASAVLSGVTFERTFGSEALRAMSYNPVTEVLTLRFANNSTGYVFREVGAATVARLVASRSKGGFYHQKIKGNFPS